MASGSMIEDQELRELFAAESEEHLHQLETGLLHLEKHPDDMAVLKDLFREAHSLKGAARMLGVRDVETLAHHFEDFLGAASKGQRTFTAVDVDRLTGGLDDIRALVEEAVTGKAAHLTLTEALQRLTQPLDTTGGGVRTPAAKAVVPPPPHEAVSVAPEPASHGSSRVAAVEPPSWRATEPTAPIWTEPQAPEVPAVVPPRWSDAEPAAPVWAESQGAVDAAVGAPSWRNVESAVPVWAEPQRAGATRVDVATPGEPPAAMVLRVEEIVAPVPVLSEAVAVPMMVTAAAAEEPAPATPKPGGAPQAVAEGGTDGVVPESADVFTGSEEAAPIIRVRSNKLDALLRLVGELTVVRTRIKRRLVEIEEIIATWEERSGHEATQQTGMGNLLERADPCGEQLGNRLLLLRHGIVEDEAGLELVAESLEEGIRNLRLLPLSTLFGLFPRLVRDVARQQDKEVVLLTEGGETAADKRILEEMKSPLMHLIRNAVDHGLEMPEVREKVGKSRAGTVTLRATQTATHVVLSVRDDGRGLDLEAIRRQACKRGLLTEEALASFSAEQLYPIIFQSGFSTSTMVTDISGRGVGLDVVRAQVERLKGRIQVTSELGHGSCFTIALPITLATTPVFIASANGQLFAVPLDAVHSVRRVVPEEIFPIEGCDTMLLRETNGHELDGSSTLDTQRSRLQQADAQQIDPLHNTPISVVRLAQLLDLSPAADERPPPPWPCIIFNMGGDDWLGVICDTLEDELEVVLKPFGGLLQRVRNLSGTTILGSGRVCMVVNPQDLLLTVRKRGRHLSESGRGPDPSAKVGAALGGQATRKKTILLAEDSLTTRTQEKRILQGAGYEVIAAVDGLDALNKLGKQPIDAVVSDVQMPNLDGLALAQKIRENPLYKDLPLILVTSLSSDEDMRRGMEVGANAYITKPTFEQKTFLETLQRLV